MLNKENEMEMVLKFQADHVGYYLRNIPSTDLYFNILGPYYLVHKASGRVEYKKMNLNEVYQILEKKTIAKKERKAAVVIRRVIVPQKLYPRITTAAKEAGD